MKRSQKSTLVLARETLRGLSNERLGEVAGGAKPSSVTICPGESACGSAACFTQAPTCDDTQTPTCNTNGCPIYPTAGC
jgi:hypothetical protein